MARKAYHSEKISVSFDLQRCIHARECVRGLPEAFDNEKRPWIQPDRAEPDAITTVVLRCPTGALQFEREDGVRETLPEENVIAIAENGPLYARGDIEIKSPLGDTLFRETRVALCRCGASQNKPFCDNTRFAAAATLRTNPSATVATLERAGARTGSARETKVECHRLLGMEEIGLKEGETVLIAGAAGGVGTMVVQIAAYLGARGLSTASPPNHGYLRSVGAAKAIEYNGDWVAAVRNIALNGVDADEARLREDPRRLPAVVPQPDCGAPGRRLA